MGMAAILFNDAKPFKLIVNILQQKAPCEIWWKLLKWFHRRHLKITQFLYMYIA